MSRSRYLAGLAALAIAALVVAVLRRHSYEDSTAALKSIVDDSRGAGQLDFSGFNAFDPFHIGNGYLWLGLAAGLAVACLCLVLAGRWESAGRRLLPAAMAVAAAASLAVAIDKRHEFESTLPEIQGAYFNESDNGSILASGDTPHSVFDPFAWGNAYLWLGVAAGLLAGAALLGSLGLYKRRTLT